jgi:hypothetical protein
MKNKRHNEMRSFLLYFEIKSDGKIYRVKLWNNASFSSAGGL